MSRVLVTGGAGFIGSHVVDLLTAKGHQVVVLDSLEEQVHGKDRKPPAYLNKDAKFVVGQVGDRKLLAELLNATDAVVHLAAKVGVGQSMYQIEGYMAANTGATATLLDVLVNDRPAVRKLVVASSMSVYGEGKYFCENCKLARFPEQRPQEILRKAQWDPVCPTCRRPLLHAATDEESFLQPTSIYAMSKRHQEETCLLVGRAYGIPTVALRFFNVYGPRQALSNPYTGVCAIFTSRILNRKPPFIFEDGQQLRDFVHVSDVANACLLALERSDADYLPVNIGTGKPASILQIAETLVGLHGADLKPEVSNQFRKGDVRHCYADLTRANKLLRYKPKVELRDGLAELAAWAKENGWGAVDLFEKAMAELKDRKLA